MQAKVCWLAVVLAACGTAQAQWEMESSGTTADLRGIDNVGSGVAWASGTNGTVLRTEDGGYLWQACTIPPGAGHLDFRGIQAFDANTAIVTSSGKGDLSRLYKTTDGCHTWKLVFTNPDKDGFWDAVHRDSQGLIWLLGDPVDAMFTLFTSKDDGENWYRWFNEGVRVQPGTQAAFAASNSSLEVFDGPIFGAGGVGGSSVFKLTESWMCFDCSLQDENPHGVKDTWKRYPVPLGGRSATSGVFAIAGAGRFPGMPIEYLTLIAVGGDYTKPNGSIGTAAYSTDAARHWRAATPPPHGYRSAVAHDAASKTWITVGPNGTDISTDDGKNWRALHPDPAMHEAPDADRDWNALSLPFVVGPHGRIGKLRAGVLSAAGK
jgi:photosystem II stability/assembly factor-like uncharacterized protein